MSHGRNKYQSRENRVRVRELLFREWDPIGINDNPNAASEYNRYADHAYVMLMDEGASADEIAAYLLLIATGHMRLEDCRERLVEKSNAVANLLVSMRPEFAAQ